MSFFKRFFKRKRNTILFHRNFQFFTGGHLKVWHYFEHVAFQKKYQAQIYFGSDTIWDNNPWLSIPAQHVQTWQPECADILFIEGIDWQILPDTVKNNPQKPIINLIQGVRHARPEIELYHYLKHRAIRICVSQQVADVLTETNQVNGPLIVNPNGLDWNNFPKIHDWHTRSCDILISGRKQPTLADELQQKLFEQYPKLKIKTLTNLIARDDFLNQLNQAKIAIFLPHFIHTHGEGFYLPALEGMALKTLVICPDCIGNRSFCLHQQNCLQPEYTIDSILQTTHEMLELSPEKISIFQQRGKETAQQYSLQQERQNFLKILKDIHHIW